MPSDPQEIEMLVDRALWLATAGAVAAAAVSTAIVWWVAGRFRRQSWRLASRAVGVVGLAVAYVASGLVLLWLLESQLTWQEGAMARIYVHPGPVHKVLPIVSILATWLLLNLRKSPSAPLSENR
jgi:ABC-type dipeptide/oligopeptide/nickel transport system permease component